MKSHKFSLSIRQIELRALQYFFFYSQIVFLPLPEVIIERDTDNVYDRGICDILLELDQIPDGRVSIILFFMIISKIRKSSIQWQGLGLAYRTLCNLMEIICGAVLYIMCEIHLSSASDSYESYLTKNW